MPESQQAVERFPINFDMIQKGHIFTVEELERITNTKRDDKKFPLKVLGLKSQVERELADRHNPVTTKIENLSLRILTDAEATEYNEQQGEHAVRKAYRALRRQLNVDVRNLTEDQRKEHGRRLVSQGAVVSAIRETRRRLSVEPHDSDHRRSIGNARADHESMHNQRE